MNRWVTLSCFLFFATFLTQDASALEQRSEIPPPQTASSPTPPGSAGGAATQATSNMPNRGPKRIAAYTLSPELYRKAKTLGRIRFFFRLFSFFYGLFVLWFILERRYSAKFRDWAESASRKRYLQVVIYVPLLIVTIALLQLPLDLFNEILFKRYGISIQSWPSWTGDWFKIQSLTILAATLLTLLLYAIIRRSPQRWWFYFWLIALPIFLFFFFLQPYVIDPMFNEFRPLSAKAPAIVPELQRIARRAGMEISPERMFWMKASDKTIYCNAYVTGFGASKRIVIWDTCFSSETTDGILTIFGHELGHYALGHIWKGLAFFSLLAFVLLCLGRRSIGWLLSKYGGSWGVRNLEDWHPCPHFCYCSPCMDSRRWWRRTLSAAMWRIRQTFMVWKLHMGSSPIPDRPPRPPFKRMENLFSSILIQMPRMYFCFSIIRPSLNECICL